MTARTEKMMEHILAWIAAAVMTALISWATWSTAQTSNHGVRLSVVETRTNNIDKSLDEIKANQRETNRLIEQLAARRK